MRFRTIFVLPLAATIAGCHAYQYHPAPLAPPVIAQALETRSLDDPALRDWMRQAAGFTAPAWPLQQWDLNSLTLAAFYFSPDLDLARARTATADAAIQTAAMRPNPTVSLGPGYESAPESPYMLGFDFSVPIETAGKRGYRIAEAKHLSEASRIQIAETAWTVRTRLRSALVDYIFATQSAAALHGQQAQQSHYVDLLQARFRAGEIALPAVTEARIELTNLRQTVAAAEGQVSTARGGLAAALSVPLAALQHKSIVWSDASTPPPPNSLSANSLQALAIENRLDVQRDLANYEAAQSALQLEIARQYPDINLGPGYAFEEGAHLISLQLSAVLPLRNRNQGPIAEAEAARKTAGAQLLATQAAILADTGKAFAQYRAAYSVLQQASQAAAQTRDQSHTASAWLKAGEADRLSAVSAALQLSVAERSRIEALRQAQVALGALEDALQHPLSPAAALPKPLPRPEESR